MVIPEPGDSRASSRRSGVVKVYWRMFWTRAIQSSAWIVRVTTPRGRWMVCDIGRRWPPVVLDSAG